MKAEGLIRSWSRVLLLLRLERIIPSSFGLLMLNACIVAFPIGRCVLKLLFAIFTEILSYWHFLLPLCLSSSNLLMHVKKIYHKFIQQLYVNTPIFSIFILSLSLSFYHIMVNIYSCTKSCKFINIHTNLSK